LPSFINSALKNERIWRYVKETTSHLQNKLTKSIHLGVATSTRPPFLWKYKLNYPYMKTNVDIVISLFKWKMCTNN
jgi:hypothetical protein